MTVPGVLLAALGVTLIGVILWDAFETILVPRRIGRKFRLTRYFYILTWRLWRTAALRIRTPARREGLLGVYGPLSLILLLACWASGLIVAFALLQVAANAGAGSHPERFAMLLYMSGETFFTLGFGDIIPATGFGRVLSVMESGMGFGFLGTVIGYLPTMYSAFSQREIEISLLDARGGSPPTAAEFARRILASPERVHADGVLRGWERWSAQVLETHISYPQLAYYRSQHSNQSWLGALVTILDSSALIIAANDGHDAEQARLTFAMARHAVVDITQIFVPRYRPGAAERLPAPDCQRLRARLVEWHVPVPGDDAFGKRLATLRKLYEPYAQALAGFLLFELPPWLHAQGRRDNWQGGPWDRLLGTHAESAASGEEHF